MTILLWTDAATIGAFVALVAALTVRDMVNRIRRTLRKPADAPPVRVTIRAPWIDGGEG